MRSQLLAIRDLTDVDLAAWRHLATTAVSPNPFNEPEFVLPAVRALDVPDVLLLVVRDGETWLAAIPVRRLDAYRRVPGPCLSTWRHIYCFSGTPLVASHAPRTALERLIADGAAETGVLVLDWLETDGPLSEALTAALASTSRTVELERFERPALYRREDGAYLERAISAQHRSQYRRLRRKLEQEVGPLTLRDESANPGASRSLLALEESGWKGSAGTALATAGHGQFFSDLCTGFATTGRLRLLSLANDEHCVAMSCGLVAGSTTYEFKIAFDDEYRRYSPGIQLLIEAMGQFHSSGLACLDSCADFRTAWTQRFLADRRTLRSIVATPRDAAGAAQAAKWRAAATALTLKHRYEALGGADAARRELRRRVRTLSPPTGTASHRA